MQKHLIAWDSTINLNFANVRLIPFPYKNLRSCRRPSVRVTLPALSGFRLDKTGRKRPQVSCYSYNLWHQNAPLLSFCAIIFMQGRISPFFYLRPRFVNLFIYCYWMHWPVLIDLRSRPRGFEYFFLVFECSTMWYTGCDS